MINLSTCATRASENIPTPPSRNNTRGTINRVDISHLFFIQCRLGTKAGWMRTPHRNPGFLPVGVCKSCRPIRQELLQIGRLPLRSRSAEWSCVCWSSDPLTLFNPRWLERIYIPRVARTIDAFHFAMVLKEGQPTLPGVGLARRSSRVSIHFPGGLGA